MIRSLSDERSADFAHLAPVFLGVQLLFYAGASFLAAWLADPDPEASRLAARERALAGEFEKLLAKRAALSAPVTSALSSARLRCEEIACRALWNVASYRAGNLSARPRGDAPPEFLLGAVASDVFEPVWLDPPPDPPADTLADVMKAK